MTKIVQGIGDAIGDVVKGLLMWVETTEERAERDHVQAVAKAGAAPLGAGPG
jgi:hypothetical protein